jgi:hypothetical protein
VNQTIRNLRLPEPYFDIVETPVPNLIAIVPIAHGVGNQSHIITEAVAFPHHDDLPSWYKGRWLVRQRDTRTQYVRESTATYPDSRAAFNAYWYASADDPVEFEAWVAPCWASAQVA